jgi:hypothetical protein
VGNLRNYRSLHCHLLSCDVNKNGFYATGTFIILIALYYWGGNFSAFLAIFSWKASIIYLSAGLIYSVIRTFFTGRNLGKRMKTLPSEDLLTKKESWQNTKEKEKEKFINDLKGNVFRWWFLWPVSLITWTLTDLVAEAWDWCYNGMKKFYNGVLEVGIKSVGGK